MGGGGGKGAGRRPRACRCSCRKHVQVGCWGLVCLAGPAWQAGCRSRQGLARPTAEERRRSSSVSRPAVWSALPPTSLCRALWCLRPSPPPPVRLQDKAVEKAAALFAEADSNKDNCLSRTEVTDLLKRVGGGVGGVCGCVRRVALAAGQGKAAGFQQCLQGGREGSLRTNAALPLPTAAAHLALSDQPLTGCWAPVCTAGRQAVPSDGRAGCHAGGRGAGEGSTRRVGLLPQGGTLLQVRPALPERAAPSVAPGVPAGQHRLLVLPKTGCGPAPLNGCAARMLAHLPLAPTSHLPHIHTREGTWQCSTPKPPSPGLNA